jgi:uncharacterized membrane protein YfhO
LLSNKRLAHLSKTAGSGSSCMRLLWFMIVSLMTHAYFLVVSCLFLWWLVLVSLLIHFFLPCQLLIILLVTNASVACWLTFVYGDLLVSLVTHDCFPHACFVDYSRLLPLWLTRLSLMTRACCLDSCLFLVKCLFPWGLIIVSLIALDCFPADSCLFFHDNSCLFAC